VKAREGYEPRRKSGAFFMGVRQIDKTTDQDEAVRNPCEECPNWVDIKQERLRLARILTAATDGLEARLRETNGGLKPSVGDYLKLLELAKEIEKETDDEEPKEVKFTWVDPVSKGK
jgi:hypothetical protein